VSKKAKPVRTEMMKFRTTSSLKGRIAGIAAAQNRSASSYLEALCRSAASAEKQSNRRA